MGCSMELQGKNLIAGNWEDGLPEAGFQAANPATGEPLEPTFHDATPAQLDAAIASAHGAFAAFRGTTPVQRADFLELHASPAVRNIPEQAEYRPTGQPVYYAFQTSIDASLRHLNNKKVRKRFPAVRNIPE